ncbi:hypothetical protein [Hahella ganghwensis]|uniref:type III secretion apparatus assembly protein SctX n=1 Tax=Hahella ganghwensis TaxID=286420 RepID=UPI00037F98B5|nr:hypothetical protein [Hahella ganghwensis]
MDLITFTEGVQSIRIQENDRTAKETSSRAFVPRGESVIQHTEKLFIRESSNQELLRTLIIPNKVTGTDPILFDTMAVSTQATLKHLTQLAEADTDPAYLQALNRAQTVLDALNEDRRLLQSNLAALEKI